MHIFAYYFCSCAGACTRADILDLNTILQTSCQFGREASVTCAASVEARYFCLHSWLACYCCNRLRYAMTTVNKVPHNHLLLRSKGVQAFHAGPARTKPHTKCFCRCQQPSEQQPNSGHVGLRLGAAAGMLSLGLAFTQPSFADLNKFEAAAGGEFGVGTAMQYGEAELRGKDFSGQVRAAEQGQFLAHAEGSCCTILCRICGDPTSLQQTPGMPTLLELSYRVHTSSRQSLPMPTSRQDTTYCVDHKPECLMDHVCQ